MNIGIVLSKTPTYSETFFISKIKGLLSTGHQVILYVQYKDLDFKLCEVKQAPKVYTKNFLLQLIEVLRVLWVILLNINRVIEFVGLEKKAGRNKMQILKNIYNNAHLLPETLDWLHFGFATIAINSENVASTIGAKMGVSLRGFDMDVFPLKHPNPYRILWQKVDKVHAISEYMLSQAYERGMSKATPYQIITPAIDINRFEPGRNENQKNHFFTIARLHWIKGLNYTLEALAILKNKNIEFTYYIAGTGPERAELLYAIHQLNLEDSVFLIGKQSGDEIVEHLQKASIYIQYSLSEGFCNAVLEAQAMGNLCIVSDAGALRENVQDKHTGFLVSPRNPELLAAKIEEVISLSKEEKTRITGNARERVRAKFNLKQQEQEFAKFFD